MPTASLGDQYPIFRKKLVPFPLKIQNSDIRNLNPWKTNLKFRNICIYMSIIHIYVYAYVLVYVYVIIIMFLKG